MKKGVLFTVGIVSMMLVIVVFSIIIYNNSINSREITAQVGLIDRINDVGISIEEGLKDIFDFKANISVSVNNLNVEFEEELPNTNSFTASMQDYRDYIELEFNQDPKVNINLSKVTENLPLIIKPQGITYSHTDGFGNNEISITPEEYNFYQYELNIDTLGQALNAFDISKESTCSDGDACNILTVIVNNNLEYNKTIDMSNDNTYTLDLPGSDTVSIKVDYPGLVTINNNANKISVKSKIYLDKFNDERVDVSYPQNIVEVNLKSLNVFKRGTVTIAY